VAHLPHRCLTDALGIPPLPRAFTTRSHTVLIKPDAIYHPSFSEDKDIIRNIRLAVITHNETTLYYVFKPILPNASKPQILDVYFRRCPVDLETWVKIPPSHVYPVVVEEGVFIRG
jgi:hypothetical protein